MKDVHAEADGEGFGRVGIEPWRELVAEVAENPAEKDEKCGALDGAQPDKMRGDIFRFCAGDGIGNRQADDEHEVGHHIIGERALAEDGELGERGVPRQRAACEAIPPVAECFPEPGVDPVGVGPEISRVVGSEVIHDEHREDDDAAVDVEGEEARGLGWAGGGRRLWERLIE